MLNSQNILEAEQIGGAKSQVAKKTTEKTRKGFTVPTISEEEERTRDLTLKIVLPCVFITTDFGDMVTNVIITPNIWKEDWGNKDLKTLK